VDILGYKRGGISAYYSDVSQAPSSDSIYSETVIFTRPFNTEKVTLWVRFGLAEEKSAFSRANFDINVASTSENIFEIQALGGGFQFERNVCVVFQNSFCHTRT
jgi:hypothetical protein